ncbi:MAG: Membrane protein [Verrucomicrobiaceae bacterium]|nr:Membrane protein [Verrucomicrobiaceae bacterium]
MNHAATPDQPRNYSKPSPPTQRCVTHVLNPMCYLCIDCGSVYQLSTLNSQLSTLNFPSTLNSVDLKPPPATLPGMTRTLCALLAAASLGAIVPRFVGLGFTHILPGGLDHILFILGLFFMARDAASLILQVTLFTLAHSLTLGLSLHGIAVLPTQWVEVAIALSIAFIAIENLFMDHLSRWRPFVVFAFGLVHGLGFAHTFQDEAVSAEAFLPALFSFNLGIELGQLAVIGLAFAAVAAWWQRDWYRTLIARPASALIAMAGLYWAVERSV